MIVALEGPDCCGKSTVFNLLRKSHLNAKFVPPMPMCAELLPVMSYVEYRQATLWEHLYNPDWLYVCDRTVFTSAPVYDRLYNRPMLVDIAKWRPYVRVVYFNCPVHVLEQRYSIRGDALFDAAKYERVRELYEDMLQYFKHIRVDATKAPDVLADYIVTIIEAEYARYCCIPPAQRNALAVQAPVREPAN